MIYPKKVSFNDYLFFVNENVYEPAEDTYLLAEFMNLSENDFVLDVGTGCGILAVLAAAKTKNQVIAVDINPHAIRCSKNNAELNQVKDKIEFLLSDLFSGIKNKEIFSLIIFNSPYLPSEPDEEKSWIDKSWAGGPTGRTIIDRFIREAPRYLQSNGKVWLLQSSLSNIDCTLKMFDEQNFDATVVAQVKAAFECIVLVEAKYRNKSTN
jgi:release factor glutamine methyltransferase